MRASQLSLIGIIGVILIVVTFFIVPFAINRSLRDHSEIQGKDEYYLKVLRLKEYRGSVFINDSLSVETAYDNSQPRPLHLFEFLSVGDSLVKHAQNDTIVVIKSSGESRWFKLH